MHLTFALLLPDADALPLYAAARALAPLASAYCLAPGQALAHVTLAQFEGLDAARAARAPFLGQASTIAPTDPYLWPGRGRHKGCTWAGVGVAATPDLWALRMRAVAFLEVHGAEILTPDPWTPHITLARLTAPPDTWPVVGPLPPAFPSIAVLGHSGPQGQFIVEVSCAKRGA